MIVQCTLQIIKIESQPLPTRTPPLNNQGRHINCEFLVDGPQDKSMGPLHGPNKSDKATLEVDGSDMGQKSCVRPALVSITKYQKCTLFQ